MGKRSHNRRRGSLDFQRMGEHGERSRSGSAERGGVSDIDLGSAKADRNDAHQSGRGGNSVSLDERDVHRRDPGIRISRGSPGSLTRVSNAVYLNTVLNDPEVFSRIGMPGLDRFDVSAIVADRRNFVFVVDGGALLFTCIEPGAYEGHFDFLQGYRGRYAIEAINTALHWMFTRTDCVRIAGKIPDQNKPARWVCKYLGAAKEFDRTAIWATADGFADVSFWSMSYERWIDRDASVEDAGRKFQSDLLAERSRLGHESMAMEWDHCVYRRLGAAIETIIAGPVEKAVILYNRWAAFAMAPVMNLIARDPLVIDFDGALLQFSGSSFKAIKCR